MVHFNVFLFHPYIFLLLCVHLEHGVVNRLGKSEEVLSPDSELVVFGLGDRGYSCLILCEVGIGEVLGRTEINFHPNAYRLLFEVLNFPFELRIEEKGTVFAGVDMLSYEK